MMNTYAHTPITLQSLAARKADLKKELNKSRLATRPYFLIFGENIPNKSPLVDKWGYIMRDMKRDMRENNVEYAYAYNSPFDDEVFTFNCDWYKTNNPLENVPVLDIRGMVSEFITNTADYRDFCETYQRFTDSGNYSGNAETVYQYITQDSEFTEAHTALADSEIEMEILTTCLDLGAEIGKEYKVTPQLHRYPIEPLTVKVDGEIIYQGHYRKKYVRKGLYSFNTQV